MIQPTDTTTLVSISAVEGAHCISLGAQLPITEIVRAAAAHHCDIVALSFYRRLSGQADRRRFGQSAPGIVFKY